MSNRNRTALPLADILALAPVLLALGCDYPLSLDGFLYDPLPAPAGGYKLSVQIIRRYENLYVDTPDGQRLHMVFVPAAGGGTTRPRTIVYFHGQSHNIGKSWQRIEYLFPAGHEIYVVDPRGYGLSTGKPSEKGLQIDVSAVHRYLIDVRGVPATRLVYYGRSLGGALAIHLASLAAPAALITESAFTSVDAMVRDGAYVDLPGRFVADSVWDNVGKLHEIQVPYLIIHGTDDPYVKFSYAEELADAHPGVHELLIAYGADHGNVPETLEVPIYRARINRFLQDVP
jgi:uncharacterized protein